MMANGSYCTNCGNPLIEGASFCTNCGAKVADAHVDAASFIQSAQKITSSIRNRSAIGFAIAAGVLLVALVFVGIFAFSQGNSDDEIVGTWYTASSLSPESYASYTFEANGTCRLFVGEAGAEPKKWMKTRSGEYKITKNDGSTFKEVTLSSDGSKLAIGGETYYRSKAEATAAAKR